jgi:hypothetical protein
LIAEMLSARHLVRTANPDLVAWSSGQWRAWLAAQRNAWTDMSQPRLIVAAALTCIEDLPLHVGLMQLLALRNVRCRVILSVPSDATGRLVRAQARRDGWELLVTILTETECDKSLGSLPESSTIFRMLRPAVLPPELLKAVPELCRSSRSPNCPTFAGSAKDYASWRDAVQATRDDFFGAVERILSLDVKQFPLRSAQPRRTGENQEGPWRGKVAPLHGRIQLPDCGEGDELVVATSSPHPITVVRQPCELLDGDKALRIRVPALLLTVTPQPIRVERQAADGTISGTELEFHVPPSSVQPWMVSAFLNRGGAGNSVIRAFAQGVGCRIAYAEDEPERLSEIPVVWGVLRDSDRILTQAKAQQLYFFYIDHAYFNRGHRRTYRITRNRYEAGPVRRVPDDRLGALSLEIAPWRKAGREIIVCPPTEYFMLAHGCPDWLETTLETLRNCTDRPIIVRSKPKAGDETVPLATALETAHALVTHSSNVAIEAACLGTPVFVASASAAAAVGRTDLAEIESPAYPDRQAWLAHLAYNQFSFEEIRDGSAWRMLLELEERDLV